MRTSSKRKWPKNRYKRVCLSGTKSTKRTPRSCPAWTARSPKEAPIVPVLQQPDKKVTIHPGASSKASQPNWIDSKWTARLSQKNLSCVRIVRSYQSEVTLVHLAQIAYLRFVERRTIQIIGNGYSLFYFCFDRTSLTF